MKAAREIEKIIPFWELTPHNELLADRQENEAYLTLNPGEVYLLFFPDEGEVQLDLSNDDSDFTLKWMNVRKGEWDSESSLTGGKMVNLKTPGNKEWVAVVKRITSKSL